MIFIPFLVPLKVCSSTMIKLFSAIYPLTGQATWDLALILVRTIIVFELKEFVFEVRVIDERLK